MKNQGEVSTFSGQGISLYPNHYSRAFASSHLPYPLSHQRTLRLAFPKGRITGLPSSIHSTGRVRGCLFAGGIVGCVTRVRSVLSLPLAFWLKPISTLGLSILTTFINRSLPFPIPSFLAPYRVGAPGVDVLSRFCLHPYGAGFVVLRASHPAVTGNACRSRKRVVAHTVRSKLTPCLTVK